MNSIHISLAAEKIFDISGFPVTNSLLTTWISMAILILVSYLATSNMKKIPAGLQSVFEILIDGLYNLFHSVLGDKTKKFFPLLATIFLFVLTMNWVGLLPGVGTVGFSEEAENEVHAAEPAEVSDDHTAPMTGVASEEQAETGEHHATFTPLLRAGTADLNTTLALALIAVGVIQYAGFKSLGLGYLGKFINFSSPINFVLGLLEAVSEVSRIVSFSFRLYGNVFAGEVLLTVIAFFVPFLAPLPFLGLELFVGVIQGLVFSMLTAVFLSLAMASHAEH